MLSIPKALEEKKIYIPLREFIFDVVMSRGNRRFLLTNLQARIRGVTAFGREHHIVGTICSCLPISVSETKTLLLVEL